jgi:hypothetical protein
MPLKVPQRHIKPLSWLLKASDDLVTNILGALSAAQTTTSVGGLGRYIARAIRQDAEDVVEVIGVLASLCLLYDSGKQKPIDEFVREVRLAMDATGAPELRQPADGWERFERNLLRLLQSKRLWTVAKVTAIRTEHGRVYCSGRLYTDARPVFESDVTQGPVAFAVVHSLKLTVHVGETL